MGHCRVSQHGRRFVQCPVSTAFHRRGGKRRRHGLVRDKTHIRTVTTGGGESIPMAVRRIHGDGIFQSRGGGVVVVMVTHFFFFFLMVFFFLLMFVLGMTTNDIAWIIMMMVLYHVMSTSMDGGRVGRKTRCGGVTSGVMREMTPQHQGRRRQWRRTVIVLVVEATGTNGTNVIFFVVVVVIVGRMQMRRIHGDIYYRDQSVCGV